jgi:DNA-binding NtrC family response regulator
MKKGSILVVDDNKGILTALNMLLPIYFKEVELLQSPNTLVTTIRNKIFDVVLLDMNFHAGVNTGNEGFYWLSEIKKYSPVSEVVLFTAYADIDLAVNAMKSGAFDFVVKPWDNAKLISTLMAAYELSLSKKELKQLREIKNEFKQEGDMFWGDSSKMKELRSLIEKVASTDASILITGENGTGKDVLAREIHRLSKRSAESMVSVDIGSLPESLFESELFGHIKGAFTDAKADRAGKFEVANYGTLFLDEIGNIPMHIQSKLLSAIQNKYIVRVGSNKPIPVDIRLITATNKNLEESVAKGEFREDLLYRINTIHIQLPPLRDRKEDILPLTTMFLKRYASKYGKNISSIDQNAVDKLKDYKWNGNIRELQHSVEKAVILCEGNTLVQGDFLLVQQNATKSEGSANMEETTLEEMEREMIAFSLKKYEGNLSIVAKKLGVTRQTLYNKLKKYDL